MNKLILIAFLFLLAFGGQAQSRKYVSNFSAYQHFYNPSLTGHEGSILKTFYRNQWTGFEDAPKTLFFSGEIDAADLSKTTDRTSHYHFRNSAKGYQGARHAFGFVALQDRFGPTHETQLAFNYGTGIRLSESLSLRWGAAITYNNFRLDGNSLVVDNTSDPRYQHVMGQYNSMSKLDLNLGFALTGGNYFLGYAMQDITKGHFMTTGDAYMKDVYTRKHLVQAGFRTDLSDQFGLVTSALYQYDEQIESTLEGQAKVVYQDMLWAGGGYRNNQAFHLAAGLNYKKLRLSYAYESPIQEARSINRPTNEIGLAYTLKAVNPERSDRSTVTFW
ncbi:type IX secretion system membrane protein PorP/SprF [Pontibacter sp. JH31]|uniref:Type IX secretion system membrane protein PorP/SprF n=1 Tax=Pontibacter aquaedesilientis TaxID=2766980 RepID=A0ABR7XFR1_9BACT|nr:type IX secretion system membrane protein PorP/SprF [Pontibacter aquaedesilientis]MBD1396433.1 type IX secretion system membrane protein PorP/SprF [Pontibacter aquaedesilientis]